jgi:hypothetical protein
MVADPRNLQQGKVRRLSSAKCFGSICMALERTSQSPGDVTETGQAPLQLTPEELTLIAAHRSVTSSYYNPEKEASTSTLTRDIHQQEMRTVETVLPTESQELSTKPLSDRGFKEAVPLPDGLDIFPEVVTTSTTTPHHMVSPTFFTLSTLQMLPTVGVWPPTEPPTLTSKSASVWDSWITHIPVIGGWFSEDSQHVKLASSTNEILADTILNRPEAKWTTTTSATILVTTSVTQTVYTTPLPIVTTTSPVHAALPAHRTVVSEYFAGVLYYCTILWLILLFSMRFIYGYVVGAPSVSQDMLIALPQTFARNDVHFHTHTLSPQPTHIYSSRPAHGA